MATDIAFAVGVLALLGRRVPPALRLTLLALAVIDDLGAVVVIAVVFSSGFGAAGLALVASGLIAIQTMKSLRVRSSWAYLPPALATWAGAYAMGVHPTLAGVAVGLMTPVGSSRGDAPDGDSPLERLEHAFQPWVSFGVMPIFALANAGVALGGVTLGGPPGRVFAGVALGLVLGKPIGVIGFSWIAVRLRAAHLPPGVSWLHMLVLGLIAGTGFTMSLFMTSLALSVRTRDGSGATGHPGRIRDRGDRRHRGGPPGIEARELVDPLRQRPRNDTVAQALVERFGTVVAGPDGQHHLDGAMLARPGRRGDPERGSDPGAPVIAVDDQRLDVRAAARHHRRVRGRVVDADQHRAAQGRGRRAIARRTRRTVRLRDQRGRVRVAGCLARRRRRRAAGPKVAGRQRCVQVVDLPPERLQRRRVRGARLPDQLASSSTSSSGKRSRITPYTSSSTSISVRSSSAARARRSASAIFVECTIDFSTGICRGAIER